MIKKTTIFKIYSFLFLFLIVFSLLGNIAHAYTKKEQIKKKEVVNQSDSTDKGDSSQAEKLIEKPFHAVVNAGLQWDFSKVWYILPTWIEFFVPEEINLICHQEITPLAYFVTLFYTSICVHAP
ncbi:MAG: hypothetical protein OHK0057_37210 [Thermoflexibacter sp.]